MNFSIATLCWFVGLFITSFTILPVIIIFRFGIPFTKELEGKDMLVKDNKIINRYFTSIAILLSVFIITLTVLYFVNEHGFRGFIGGSVLTLLFGIWQTGKNKNNLADYVKVNNRYFK